MDCRQQENNRGNFLIKIFANTHPKPTQDPPNTHSYTLTLTVCLPTERVWRHSTCRLQTEECQHKSCSSCRTSWGEWSLSALCWSPVHLAPGQTPTHTHTGRRWLTYTHTHTQGRCTVLISSASSSWSNTYTHTHTGRWLTYTHTHTHREEMALL